jgi:hypothetical protein
LAFTAAVIASQQSDTAGVQAVDKAVADAKVAAEVTEAELRYLARLSLLQEFPPEPKEGKRRRFQFLPLIKTFVQQQADSEVLRSARLVKPCGTLL